VKFANENKIEIVHASRRDYPPWRLIVRRRPTGFTRHVLFSDEFWQKFVLSNASKVITCLRGRKNLRKTLQPKDTVIMHSIENRRTDAPADDRRFRQSFVQCTILKRCAACRHRRRVETRSKVRKISSGGADYRPKFPPPVSVVVGADNSSGRNYRRTNGRQGFGPKNVFCGLIGSMKRLSCSARSTFFVSLRTRKGLAIVEVMASSRAVKLCDRRRAGNNRRR